MKQTCKKVRNEWDSQTWETNPTLGETGRTGTTNRQRTKKTKSEWIDQAAHVVSPTNWQDTEKRQETNANEIKNKLRTGVHSCHVKERKQK